MEFWNNNIVVSVTVTRSHRYIVENLTLVAWTNQSFDVFRFIIVNYVAHNRFSVLGSRAIVLEKST